MAKKIFIKKGYAGPILMNLSEAFNTTNHFLLIEKLHDYGFSKEALLIILDYMSCSKKG